MLPQNIACPRKRRRQNWHNKNKLKKKASSSSRPTKDQGKWDQPPPAARRQIFIEDKLKVANLYIKLQKEREAARTLLSAGIPRGIPEKQREQLMLDRSQAKASLKGNIAKICQTTYPQILQNTGSAWKWASRCQNEAWNNIPRSDRVRWVEVPNYWRSKLKMAEKGRPVGGDIPLEIQMELDRLVAEHCMGNSDISERKEVVSMKHIDPRTQCAGH